MREAPIRLLWAAFGSLVCRGLGDTDAARHIALAIVELLKLEDRP